MIALGGLILGQLFMEPIPIGGSMRLVMLLPLSLAVAIVYKTIHCRDLRDVPIASIVLWVTIVLGMLAVGGVLYVAFFLLA